MAVQGPCAASGNEGNGFHASGNRTRMIFRGEGSVSIHNDGYGVCSEADAGKSKEQTAH
jgi:hypothetical protein